MHAVNGEDAAAKSAWHVRQTTPASEKLIASLVEAV